jgi:dipeptidyl-peptidase-4
MNRLQNVNRVMLWNTVDRTIRTVLTETDPAWLENENPVRWIDRGNGFIWLSERDGWRHAYRADTDGVGFTAITRGAFDIIEVEMVDEARRQLYFAASPEAPTRRDLYRVSLDGGTPEKLSPADQSGWHTYDFSPDAQWAIHRYSTFHTPPVVELIRAKDHRVVRVLADNAKLRERLCALDSPSVEFFRVEVGSGLSLDGWCLKPPSFDPSAKHPLLIHVYGEPHGQTVRDAWQGTRGLWHWMLAQQGYLVASVDNRGTNVPRGREWRKCVHRQIGILAPEEQAAALRALLSRWPFADAQRVGIWGWSGGGSMSLNAIFRYPELYHTAIAVAPNADQRLYDTIYQERYMGLPADNADGYRLGSPITFAEHLKGSLLLIHGTGDDNGHYQGTEMLVNELIAHQKQFTIMPYPARSHAIDEGRNTVHHFYSLMTRYLHEHLPVSPHD